MGARDALLARRVKLNTEYRKAAADHRVAVSIYRQQSIPLCKEIMSAECHDLFDKAMHLVDLIAQIDCALVVIAKPEDCPGHVASEYNPKICGRCGVHIDSLRPPDDDFHGEDA